MSCFVDVDYVSTVLTLEEVFGTDAIFLFYYTVLFALFDTSFLGIFDEDDSSYILKSY